jgi:Cysteine-rich CWC
MAEIVRTEVEKKCSRCGKNFSCRQEAGCWCASVRVEAALLGELRARYADCLCEVCLRELAAGRK